MSKPFYFKQFAVHQDRCAMKIGTDGVLIGAWTSLENSPMSILDIGAGTGLIALMLAQRSNAETIDAIEIDEDAYEQCVENFEASPWGDRLFCYHAGLDEMVDEIEAPYDLIISNPPFYTEDVSSRNSSRDKARQNSALPFDELLASIPKLLSPTGIFSVVIPFREEDNFLALALNYGLYPKRILHVRGKVTSPFKRSLLELSFKKTNPVIKALNIEIKRHEYTLEYTELTKAFYLKM